MGKAIRNAFSNYATFSGRASMGDYWWFALFNFLVLITASIVDAALGTMPLFYYVSVAALFLPGLSVGVRRIHDAGKSGWFILVPIYNLVLALTPSKPDNQYGPQPA